VQYRYRTNKRETISPLSTVILSRRWDLFDLLVRRGGDIKTVRDPLRPYTPPLCSFHVPIMAVAALMVTAPDGVDPELVQRCIDAGADINLTIPSTWGDYFYFIMPVLLYLNSVTSWEEKAEQGGRDAAWGLQYFLDRGATLRPMDTTTGVPPKYAAMIRQRWGRAYMGRYRLRQELDGSLVQHLLNRCPIDHLTPLPALPVDHEIDHTRVQPPPLKSWRPP
jgi:hypothetical protein